jgi:adenosyl cobinamide kinase/adenosyl cobinamide phosphate guanylyltransferase
VLSEKLDERMGERIDHHRARRARVLANLRGEIEERYDYADRGDQLRESVNRFQLHNHSLSNDISVRRE